MNWGHQRPAAAPPEQTVGEELSPPSTVPIQSAREMIVPCSMSWLLVVQPDSIQADALREALHAHVSEGVVVSSSIADALALIDQGIPDVILLPTLVPPDVEDYLITYLGIVSGTGHVQILGLPRLERSDREVRRPARTLFPWGRRQAARAVGTAACDPQLFVQDVIAYLGSARALKEETELRSARAVLGGSPERRAEARFADDEVPWISAVRLGSERTALMNLSARGALLRTRTRPEHRFLRRSESNVRERPRLTLELESNREIHVVGRVVRCVPVRTSAPMQYEVAFVFDDAVGLHLPTPGVLVPARQLPTTGSPAAGR